MELTFDAAKRDRTLEARGLDFVDAAKVFAGHHVTRIDDRQDYGEDRYITGGCSMVEWPSWCGRRAARFAASSRDEESQ